MSDRTPRRWLTFSLRSLFVLVLSVAAYFAGWRSATWTVEREKEEAVRKAVEELQAARAREEQENLSIISNVPVYTIPNVTARIGNFTNDANDVLNRALRDSHLSDDAPPSRPPQEQP